MILCLETLANVPHSPLGRGSRKDCNFERRHPRFTKISIEFSDISSQRRFPRPRNAPSKRNTIVSKIKSLPRVQAPEGVSWKRRSYPQDLAPEPKAIESTGRAERIAFETQPRPNLDPRRCRPTALVCCPGACPGTRGPKTHLARSPDAFPARLSRSVKGAAFKPRISFSDSARCQRSSQHPSGVHSHGGTSKSRCLACTRNHRS